MCQPLFFIHLRQGKYSRRPEIYGRVESGLVYTALVLIPLWFSSLKNMKQHLLVTFVDWAKLIFCDEHRTDGQTDVLVEIVM